MNPTAENYLILHRFGDFSHANNADQVKAVVDEEVCSFFCELSTLALDALALLCDTQV